MAKRRKDFASIQPDLFQQVEEHTPAMRAENAPDLYIELEFMGAVAYALREAKKRGLGRDRVVDRMNLCLPEDEKITKRQLDAWCAQSKEHHPFPVQYLPAFCWAVGGIIAPIEIITRALGLHVLDEQEWLATELGKTLVEKTQLARREQQLKRQLEG